MKIPVGIGSSIDLSIAGEDTHSPSGTYLPILYDTTNDINYVHMLYRSFSVDQFWPR